MFHQLQPYVEIQSTNFEAIFATLKKLNVKSAHFTNGTFAFPPEKTIPTTLAGFKCVLNKVDETLPLIIAVNSDKSMESIGKFGYPNQSNRSRSVAEALANTFPNNKIIVMFYDEKTPNELYAFLSAQGITHTLHKWGYGTEQNLPKIEGADKFKNVFAYPLVDDLKPICWEETPNGQQQGIEVVDLRNKLITSDRKCLFQLPSSLSIYQGEAKQAEKNCLSH